MTNFQARLIFGILGGIVVIALLWLGGPLFQLFCLLAGLIVLKEWYGIMNIAPRTYQFILALVTFILLYFSILHFMSLNPQDKTLNAISMVVLLGVFAALSMIIRLTRDIAFPGFYITGILYALILPLTAPIIRNQPDTGLMIITYILIVVWSTDTGAYFAGRTIGGPKLAPKISPNKTWAGLIGGAISAVISVSVYSSIASTMGWAFPSPAYLTVFIIPALLAVLSQMGDLFESWFKRKFNKKDSGNFLPGHGGIMDRTDGLVVSLLAGMVVL